jgi:hypothetical protein
VDGDCGSACCLLLHRMVEQGLVPPGSGGDCGHGAAVPEPSDEARDVPQWRAPEGCASGCPGLQAGASLKIHDGGAGPVRREGATATVVPGPSPAAGLLRAPDLPPIPPRGPPAPLPLQ